MDAGRRFEEIIYNPSGINQYRADCVLGQFKREETPIGESMKIEVLTWESLYGEYFGYPEQQWLHLIFIDELNEVSSLLLKTRSMRNFIKLIKSLQRSEKRVQWGVTYIKMSSFISNIDSNQYYEVLFRWIEREGNERTEELRYFMANRWRGMPEVACSA